MFLPNGSGVLFDPAASTSKWQQFVNVWMQVD